MVLSLKNHGLAKMFGKIGLLHWRRNNGRDHADNHSVRAAKYAQTVQPASVTSSRACPAAIAGAAACGRPPVSSNGPAAVQMEAVWAPEGHLWLGPLLAFGGQARDQGLAV